MSSLTLTKMAAPSSACATGPHRRTSLASVSHGSRLAATSRLHVVPMLGRASRGARPRDTGPRLPPNPQTQPLILNLIPVRAEFTHPPFGWWLGLRADADSEKQPQLHHFL